MQEKLRLLLNLVLIELKFPEIDLEFTRPEHIRHGTYSTRVAFVLSRELKQSPFNIAQTITEAVLKLKKTPPEAFQSTLSAILSIEALPPGFINVTLDPQVLLHGAVEEIQKSLKDASSRRIMVEYTDPNPFKPLHIGHLYSNAVGEAISRMLEETGNDIYRVCYQGDVGLHVGKALYGMIVHIVSAGKTVKERLEELEVSSLTEQARWLGAVYALGAQAFEEDEKAVERIKKLNILSFVAAQKLNGEVGVQGGIDYGSILATMNHVDLDVSDSEVMLLYEKGRKWSLAYFEEQYKVFGTRFDHYFFESGVAESGKKIVLEHLQDGVFEKSDNAIVYKGEKDGLHTRVFINALGLPTYEAKELGLAPEKEKIWPCNQSIIVTAKEVNEYFSVLLSAIGKIAPELAQKTIHIGHGVVKLPTGKMSSRTGNVVTAQELLTQVRQAIQDKVEERLHEYPVEEQEQILERTTIAAVKYALLKVGLPQDIAYDLHASISLEGDSGPYLLYTIVRAKNILRKSGLSINNNLLVYEENIQLTEEEGVLIRLLSFFPEIMREAAQSHSPSTICRFTVELAQAFNTLYARLPILPKEEIEPMLYSTEAKRRLMMVGLVDAAMTRLLHVLGIDAVERM